MNGLKEKNDSVMTMPPPGSVQLERFHFSSLPEFNGTAKPPADLVRTNSIIKQLILNAAPQSM